MDRIFFFDCMNAYDQVTVLEIFAKFVFEPLQEFSFYESYISVLYSDSIDLANFYEIENISKYMCCAHQNKSISKKDMVHNDKKISKKFENVVVGTKG